MKSLTCDFKELFEPEAFQLFEILRELSQSGRTSVKQFLNSDFLRVLLVEAEKADYRVQPRLLGNVRQELELCKLGEADEDAAMSGNYYNIFKLRDMYQQLINEKVEDSPAEASFLKGLCLNSIYLQRYPENSLGVSPHRDNQRFINLIFIFTLAGNSKFYICADREGNSAVELDATPGSLILLRAPGFPACGDPRPYHYLAGSGNSVRYSVSLRQINASTSQNNTNRA